MKNDYQSADFKKLLDKLQQDSWQLELIISGFAIYGLFMGIEPVEVETLKAIKNEEALGIRVLGALLSSIYVLIILLLTHVILRGIWIGAIGLRYVSGDIDYENLNYTEKFTSYLRKKVGSFDRYISRLENICSTLFALAFLMVFFFVSYFLVIGCFTLVLNLLEGLEPLSETLYNTVKVIFIVTYVVCVLLYAIDFLGGGFLKRHRFSSKLFFPIYRVFGIITLSFLYRPLLYNFLDQRNARWIVILIFPVYIVVSAFTSGFAKQNSNYLIVDQNTSSLYTNEENYEDEMTDKTDLVRFVSIPSKVIEKEYLPVFVGFNGWMEDAIFKHDTTLVPKKDRRGYNFQLYRLLAASQGSGSSVSVKSERAMEYQRRYIKCFDEIYKLQIDSTFYERESGITTNKNDRFGFETYLDIKDLSRGKHLLRFIGPERVSSDEFKVDTLITIPFWYFPESSPKSNVYSKISLDSITNKE